MRQERSIKIEHIASRILESALSLDRTSAQCALDIRSDCAVATIADYIVDDAAPTARKRNAEEILERTIGIDESAIAVRVGDEQRQRIENRAVELLAVSQCFFGFDLRADVTQCACDAKRSACGIPLGVSTQSTPQHFAASRQHSTAHIQALVVFEMATDPRQDIGAVLRVQNVLKCLEGVRKFVVGITDDFAKPRGVPHVS